MPNKTVYFTDQEYGFLLQIATKEYPEGEERSESHRGRKKKVDPLSKLIQDAALEKAKELAVKHKVKVPKKLQEGEKA